MPRPIRGKNPGPMAAAVVMGMPPGSYSAGMRWGTKAAPSSVTSPTVSRMPRPAASSPTIHAPSAGRKPSNSGSGSNSW